MFAGSHAETGDERNAPAARLPHVIGKVQTMSGGFGQGANSARPEADRPFPGISGRAHARGYGMLWLTALTFSLMKEAEAADPNVNFLDDGNINYKDFAHGSFELVTKETIPRTFVVEDPGETIILRADGASVSISRVTNSSARMAELQAAQQETLATLAKGMESTGSSTPPLVDRLPVQPINFIQTDEPITTQDSLQPLSSPNFSFTEIKVGKPPPDPPTLNAVMGPTEIDTSAFDTFTATSGTFVASSTNSAATLIYGISGGTSGSTVLNGVTYDVSQPGPFGTLYVASATGAYTFVPDSHAINALTQPTTTSFTVTVSDGSRGANQTFTIAINGANDEASISGTSTGSTVEAGDASAALLAAPVATGTLTSVDVDHPANTFTAVDTPTASAGGYGSFTMTEGGVWTYTVDEANAAVQALNVGNTLIDSFTVTSIDGTAQLVTVTIHGANDAAVISGAIAGSVVETGDAKHCAPTATGTLTAADVDNTPNTFTPIDCPTAGTGGYGSFTMTAAGEWTYVLDDRHCEVQALNIGDTLIDSITVTTIDGTEQMVTVTIHGANDPANIYGTTTGCVVEAGCHDGKPVACGTLTSCDVDNAPNTFTPVDCPTASAGGYGSFTMTKDGVWTYTLDNGNSTVQALNSCDTLCDSFTVTSIDGTAQVVKVTIQGANDPAVVSGATAGCVVEATCFDYGKPVACGTLTSADVDNANTFTPVCWPQTSAGGYGTFTMTADGVWTYTLDNANCTVEALNSCDTLTDCFTVTTIDGTAQEVKITIYGASDGYDFKASAAGDSFHFKDEVSALDGSNVIDPAGVEFVQTSISQGGDIAGIQGQLTTSVEALALEQLLTGHPADDSFSFAGETLVSTAAYQLPHDLMV